MGGGPADRRNLEGEARRIIAHENSDSPIWALVVHRHAGPFLVLEAASR